MRKLISAAILATILPAPGLPYQIEDIQETRWNVIIAVIKICGVKFTIRAQITFSISW